MSNRKRIYICGPLHNLRNYCIKNDISKQDVVHINYVDQLMGLHGIELLVVGNVAFDLMRQISERCKINQIEIKYL